MMKVLTSTVCHSMVIFNWDVVLKKLTDINYKGPIALEIMNKGYEHIKEPRVFLAIAFERAQLIPYYHIR